MLVLRFLALVDWLGARLGVNVPPVVEIEFLRSRPPGSLGHSLVEFLDRHHLQPFTTGPRRKQLHDAVHVLTGYDTDPIGEAEVQAFLLGTHFRWVHVMLGLGILGLMPRPAQRHHRRRLVQRLWQAYRRGQAAQFDVATWQPEAQWQLPLADVQTIWAIAPQTAHPI
jgi:ubiquinone biosynthesis protein COQ4